MNKQMKHLTVQDDNFDKLREYGYGGDSFNDVITRIIKHLEKNNVTRLELLELVDPAQAQLMRETD